MRFFITNEEPNDLAEDAAAEPKTIDDAWELLGRGDATAAADEFVTHTVDQQRGAEAMAGYGLSKLLAGELAEAARALRRAERIDQHIFVRVMLDEAARERLIEARGSLNQSQRLDDDAAVIERALGDLLD